MYSCNFTGVTFGCQGRGMGVVYMQWVRLVERGQGPLGKVACARKKLGQVDFTKLLCYID